MWGGVGGGSVASVGWGGVRVGSDTGVVEMFLLSMWGGVGEVLIQGL